MSLLATLDRLGHHLITAKKNQEQIEYLRVPQKALDKLKPISTSSYAGHVIEYFHA